MTMVPSHRLARTGSPRTDSQIKNRGILRRGGVLSLLLIVLILVCIIALLSSALFGMLQQRKSGSRVGGRYAPELAQYLNEQQSLLQGIPRWRVDPSNNSPVLAVPIEEAMQVIVRQYGKKGEQP
jgi:hypothetical protein